jgi:4'-phosphopantetheinyl transferase
MNISDPGFHVTAALALPENEVQLWRLDLEALAVGEDCWQQLLSADEQVRTGRFLSLRARQHFVVVRGLLRTLLAGYLSTHPKELTFWHSAKDKPSLGPPYSDSGIAFNVSHSGGVALLAFNRRREIGVDVEHVRRDLDLEVIAQRYFSAREQRQLARLPADQKYDAFFRCWTRKEAFIKAKGEGLSLPLDQFDVSLVSGDSNALLSTRPDASEAARWSLREVPAGPGYVAALCVAGHDWVLRD